MSTSEARQYTEDDVKVLEGLEAVRKRPAMYIGNTGVEGLHHLVYEIVDNCVDESFAGTCNSIKVEVLPENVVKVHDNGRGIPVLKHAQTGRPTVETVMTVLHAGAKFDNNAYKVSGGLHGVGLSVVNALAEWLEVEVHRDGKIWSMRCERGIPTEVPKRQSNLKAADFRKMFAESDSLSTSSIRCLGETKKTGTIVTFKPDLTLFEASGFSDSRLLKRLEELSYLVNGVHFKYESETASESFKSENGILDLLKKVCPENRGDFIEAELENDDMKLRIACAFNSTGNEKIMSYANGIHTHDGGTHVTTFRMAFSKAMTQFAKDRGIKMPNGVLDEIRNDVSGVVEVRLSDPQFESQTKVKLRNSSVQRSFLKLLTEFLKFEFDKQSEIVEQLLKEAAAISARKSRLKDDIAQLRKKQQKIEKSLPSKLADCTSRKFEEREIFIIEGDSAGGSLKKCKDNKRQAALPLRGKTLNIEKADHDSRVMKNESLLSIASAIGLQFSKTDYKSLRYSKVIIMTDADADGSHITLLLLSFFYSYFPRMITEGHLYVSVPPLYRAKIGSKTEYLRDDKELEAYTRTLSAKEKDRLTVQRFKGLGEMNPEQLWETCVDPATRRLLQVTVEDAEEASRMFDITLGMSSEPRKEYIRENAGQIDASFTMEVC